MSVFRTGDQGTIDLLRDASFARLFAARLINQLGNVMSPLAIAFGMLAMTGSAAQTGFVVAAQITAQIVVLLLGGALADRGHRQAILIAADLTAAVSQGVIALLLLTQSASVPLLMALAAVTGAAQGMMMPTLTGFIPQVVPRARLHAANALLGTARSSAQVLGASLAGVLVAAFDAGIVVALDAITCLLSAVLIRGVRAVDQTTMRGEPLVRSLITGWQAFTAQRWLWVVVLQFAFVVAGVNAYYGLIGPTVAARLQDGAADWGFIAAAFGLGTLTGGFLILRLPVRRPMRTAVACVFGGILPMATTLIALPVAGIAAAAFAHGICAQVFSVLWNTTLQRRIEPAALSRVSAWDYLGSICCAPIGVVGAGLLLDHAGFGAALWVAIALVAIPTAAALCVRDVRELHAD